ncbi:MAG TPA: nucleoid-associated protein [Verrucomicrobiales bacterium]|nr:nucleoid-associated protein [Verrucomicrobiales bacterium]
MSVRIRFTAAYTTGIVLAKVGNPQRDEPLQTSREVFKIAEPDQETLTALFLKPFKNLTGHRFFHHTSLDRHEMNNYAKSIFASEGNLLKTGTAIAKLLYSKSNHPNIKSGDLCIAAIKDVELEGQAVQGICILKSESVVPFLSISAKDGDLELHTEHGINPEKIDKGCLILNHFENKGFYLLIFDRAGAESKFWMRDFLGVQAVSDASFLTNTYAKMAVEFLEEQQPAESSEVEERCTAAADAIEFFEEHEEFQLEEFEEKVLKTPDMVEKFASHRSRVEEEQGQPLERSFPISKKDVSKAKKRIGAVMKLDTGVEIHLKSLFTGQRDPVLERGFDEERNMKFVKVYYNKDLSVL